jgi:hypothetical protein
MANEQTAPAQVLSEQDVAVLINNVKRPAMFAKLARDWRIEPQTQADYDSLCELADNVRLLHETELQKRAASGGNPFLAGVLGETRQQLAQAGFQPNHVGFNRQDDAIIKEAAFERTTDATIAQAALNVAVHLSQNQPAAA